MIDLRYSLVIEATSEPDFFSFYSPDLGGFSGVAFRRRLSLSGQVGHDRSCALAGGGGPARPTPQPTAPHCCRERDGAQAGWLRGRSGAGGFQLGG